MCHALASSGSWYQVGQRGQPLRHKRRWDADGAGGQGSDALAACACLANDGVKISGPRHFTEDFGGQDPGAVTPLEHCLTESQEEDALDCIPKAMAVCAVAAVAVAYPAPAKKKRRKAAKVEREAREGTPARPVLPPDFVPESCMRGTATKCQSEKLHWNEDEDIDDLTVEIIEIPIVGKGWPTGPNPPKKWIHHCPVEDDYTQVDWWYRNNQFPSEAVNRGSRFDWETFRLQSVAGARARAIELANGDGVIDTYVSEKDARRFRMHGAAACEAGADAHPWGGSPSCGANDVRTWPLIFIDQFVLRVADYDDGFALYGRRLGWNSPTTTTALPVAS